MPFTIPAESLYDGMDGLAAAAFAGSQARAEDDVRLQLGRLLLGRQELGLRRDQFAAEQALGQRPQVFQHGGLAMGLDPRTGQTRWQTRIGPEPTGHGQRLIELNLGNEVGLADPLTGQIVQRYPIGAKPTNADPLEEHVKQVDLLAKLYSQAENMAPRDLTGKPTVTPEMRGLAWRWQQAKDNLDRLQASRSTGVYAPPGTMLAVPGAAPLPMPDMSVPTLPPAALPQIAGPVPTNPNDQALALGRLLSGSVPLAQGQLSAGRYRLSPMP